MDLPQLSCFWLKLTRQPRSLRYRPYKCGPAQLVRQVLYSGLANIFTLWKITKQHQLIICTGGKQVAELLRYTFHHIGRSFGHFLQMNGLAVCTKKSIYCSVLADFVSFFFCTLGYLRSFSLPTSVLLRQVTVCSWSDNCNFFFLSIFRIYNM